MKTILAIFLTLITINGFANMASPYRPGTLGAAPFSSRNIDIIKEILVININNDFKTASFTIDYFISTDSSGRQIPLLFYAENYKNNFKVWVDDKETQLQDIPYTYRSAGNNPFTAFNRAFSPPLTGDDQERVDIKWSENNAGSHKLSDLKYFEVSLTKGAHKIHVEYVAAAWEDRSGWVKKYNYPYSLSPAKYWRSFGGLDIILNGVQLSDSITTNLGAPAVGNTGTVTSWHFNKLPGDVVEINYQPQITNFAKTLISVQPVGLTIILSVIIAALHVISMWYFRKYNPADKYSPVMIIGVVVLPVAMLFIYMYSYNIIDNAIGINASRYHGYTFMAFIFYPVLLAGYWLIMWLADSGIKRRMMKRIDVYR